MLLQEDHDEVTAAWRKKGSLVDRLVLISEELLNAKSDSSRLKIIEALGVIDVTPAAIGKVYDQ